MANIKRYLDKIRTAIYGKEVRGSLADGLEAINNETEDATEVAVNVEQRQDAVEQQFDDVLNEWSGDKPISNEETIAARTNRETGENHQTLGQRLDAENKKVNAQLAQTNDELTRVERNPKYKPRPSFAVVDDDGKTEVFTVLKRIVERYGGKLTTAIATDWVGKSGFMNLEQLESLQEEGHEIISHSKTSPVFRDLTPSQIEYELAESKRQLNEWGFEAKHFAYPHGSHSATETAVEIVRKYYESAMYGRDNRNTKPMQSYRVRRLDIGWTTHTFADYKERIDEAIENNELVVLLSHVGDDAPERIDLLEDIIAYIHSLGYTLEAYSDAYENHKNVMEIGEYSRVLYSHSLVRSGFAIGADGEFDILDKRIYTGFANQFTNESVLSDYPRDSIIVNIIQGSYADGLPTGRGGTLWCYNLSNDGSFTYREYKPAHQETVYIQRWLGSRWSDWVSGSVVHHGGNNEFTFTNVPSDFPFNRITVNIVKGSHAQGFPDNTGGELITHRLDIDDNFTSQDFKQYGTGLEYRRYWKDSNWSPFKLKNSLHVFRATEDLFNKPPSYFDEGVSVIEVKGAFASGFPNDDGGVLTVFNVSKDLGFAYQTYKRYYNDHLYIRSWYTNDWSVFSRFAKQT